MTYFRVLDATRAVIAVERYLVATSQMAQTALRSVLGKADLDMLLSERDELNESLQRIIDEQADAWGIKVTAVEIKDVEIPESMQRAMPRQAPAGRTPAARPLARPANGCALPLPPSVARATLSAMAQGRDLFLPALVRTRAMREAERLTVRQIRWRFATAVAIAAAGLVAGVALVVTLS